MFFNSFISIAAAVLCGGLATFALIRDPRSFVHRMFAFGMIALSLEQSFTAIGTHLFASMEAIPWRRLGLVAGAFVPGVWFLFSLSFGRSNYKEYLEKWRWATIATFAFPLVLVTFYSNSFYAGGIALVESYTDLRLGTAGYLFYLLILINAVLILMNLERTIRSATGSVQWQIKFLVLSVGSLFAVRVFTSSQYLLFSTVDAELERLNSIVLLIAGLLIILSYLRAKNINANLYISQSFLYNSITALAAGIYLLTVGMLAKAVHFIGGNHSLTLAALLLFLGLLALSVILLSGQLREQLKRFVIRNFKRPQYDYRKEWRTFAEQTASLMDSKQLSEAVANMVSKTFAVPAVTIWVQGEYQQHLALGGSIECFGTQAFNFKLGGNDLAELIRAIRDQQYPVDFEYIQSEFSRKLKQPNADVFRRAGIRYCAPLVSGGEFLGFMTLGAKLTKEPFSLEDLDLLKVIADQTAGSLFTLKLSERLMQRKEMEAFQIVSAFFVHDLKNLASRLSLTMQNLSTHFDDPEFRKDAMAMISKSVSKINTMCVPLSLVTVKPEFRKTETDLNELVISTIAGLNGCLKASLTQDAHSVVPKLYMDPDQMQKVIVNLILNANEAVGEGGEIRVTTDRSNGWALVTVSDNGCGMSNDFIAHSLFQPFQTTKKQGSGIGLFHSKMIVQAHHGRIEVESEEGNGSTFRVFLPVVGEKSA